MIFALTIGLLLKINKILKFVHRVSTLFNFEIRLLAPLLLSKKFILKWLKKKYNNRKISQLAEELTSEEENSEPSSSDRLIRGAKFAAIALCTWLLIRRKD